MPHTISNPETAETPAVLGSHNVILFLFQFVLSVALRRSFKRSPAAPRSPSAPRLARGVLLAVVLLSTVAIFQPHPAFAAASVVGNGTPVSCTEAAFDHALASGAPKIKFNCGAAVKTITLKTTKQLSTNRTIDGGSKIILQAKNVSHFIFSEGGTYSLKNITLTNGSAVEGGAIYNSGTLSLVNVKFENNNATTFGGAISNYGPLAISKSTFTNNHAGFGGAVFSQGVTIAADHTTFTNNQAVLVEANRTLGAAATIPDEGRGGAVDLENGQLWFQDVSFTGNKAVYGGALASDTSDLLLERAQFTKNTVFQSGGAIYALSGSLGLFESVVQQNSSKHDGGGMSVFGDLGITDSTVQGNTAGDNGGGINVGQSDFKMDGSTVSGNVANGFGGGVRSDASGQIQNSTISGNHAVNKPGGGWYQNSGAIILLLDTIANNRADVGGGGIYGNESATSQLGLGDVVLAHNTDGNCGGAVITSLGFNLSDDGTCRDVFTEHGDRNNKIAKLGPLANNGGRTLTHKPLSGSPLIDHGAPPPALASGVNHSEMSQVPNGVVAHDQRGVIRPQGTQYDIGAVEVEQN